MSRIRVIAAEGRQEGQCTVRCPIWVPATLVCVVLLTGCPGTFVYYDFHTSIEDIAVGPQNSVYVYVVEYNEDATGRPMVDDRIHEFNARGAFVRLWADHWDWDPPRESQRPTVITVRDDGLVYIAVTHSVAGLEEARIQEFTDDGQFLRVLGDDTWEIGRPTGLALGSTDSIYITDSEYSLVREFRIEGKPVRTWGGKGSNTGKFLYPDDITVGPDGSVYVADTGNRRIQRFTATGDFVRAWGIEGTGPDEFLWPTGIAAGPDGSVYVADTGNDRVQQFTARGDFVRAWNGGPGVGRGEFVGRLRVAVGNDGAVYVVDAGTNCVQKFTSEGEFVRAWGETDLW